MLTLCIFGRSLYIYRSFKLFITTTLEQHSHHVIVDADHNIYSATLEANFDTSDVCRFYKIQALESCDTPV